MLRTLLIFSFSTLLNTLFSQQTKGTLLDVQNDNPIGSVQLFVIRTDESTLTNAKGDFTLSLLSKGDLVEISGAAVIKDTLVYDGSNPWLIKSNAAKETMKTVVITHHRQKEKLRESPVTMERMTA